MRTLIAASIASLALCRGVCTAPVTSVPLPGGFLDVQYAAGSGPNTAYFVVDFNDQGNGAGTYAFAYNWDSIITPADALFSIESAPGNANNLEMQTSDFGSSVPNLFVDTFTYGTETATPTFPDTWTFFLGTYGSSQVTWGNPNDLTFGISAVDFSGNQIYSLENQHFYGFAVGSYDENFTLFVDNPRLPIAVPEPATVVLTVFGGLLLLGARIRSRRFLLRDAMESAKTPR